GRHNLIIESGGITIFPRYNLEEQAVPPPAPVASRRVSSGIARLDALLGGGLLERSVTLVSGSAGIGKSTIALQFMAEGAKHDEPGLYVALEEGPGQLLQTAEKLGLRLKDATDTGLVEIIYLSREHVRAHQFLAILADKIQARGVRRLVLDSASHLASDKPPGNELRQLLYALITRFKALGVTSLLTLEASSM